MTDSNHVLAEESAVGIIPIKLIAACGQSHPRCRVLDTWQRSIDVDRDNVLYKKDTSIIRKYI